MKVFISVDMEGTSGLERLEEIFRGLPGYDRARRLMAGDANAAMKVARARRSQAGATGSCWRRPVASPEWTSKKPSTTPQPRRYSSRKTLRPTDGPRW